MSRADAARRLGFPKCPSCKKFRPLQRCVIAGEGTPFELSVMYCRSCAEKVRSAERLIEESNQMRRSLEQMRRAVGAKSTRKSKEDLILSLHGSTHQ